MSQMFPKKKIPKSWIESWKRLGAKFLKDGGGLGVLYLPESPEAVADFMVKMSQYDVDPVVIPNYGMPQYSSLEVQLEVGNIFRSYQPPPAEDFIARPITITSQVYPGHGAWHYRNAQIPITAVISRIQNPGPQCPFINSLPVGNLICTLNILCASTVIVMHVHRE